MLVLDANILIRAVMGRRIRQLLEEYAGRNIRFYAPDDAFADAGKYLPALVEKRGKPTSGVSDSLKYLQLLVEPVD
jgi:predicted nucleic acid-binding protein